MNSSKLTNNGLSIFSEMTKMAVKHNAINLSQGFPDFSCNSLLIERVNHYMYSGYNQYAPLEGVMKLREQLSLKVKELYGIHYNPEKEINITAGATQAIYTAITTFVKEKDEVIVFEPAFDCYVPVIQLCGGYPVYLQLKHPNYRIDWDEVQKVVNSRTRMIIINSPHNPTGTTLTSADLERLQKITNGSRIIILSDEVYEHITFDGIQHQSVARFPQLAEKSLLIFSFGKTYHNTGWKIGAILANEKLMSEFRKVHQFVVYAVNTPIQYALADFLDEKNEYLKLSAFYQQKRDFFNSHLKDSKFKIIPSTGTYYQLLDYQNISDEKDFDIVEKLVIQYGVAAIPVSAFYHENIDHKVLRFCFAKSDDVLKKACEKLSCIK